MRRAAEGERVSYGNSRRFSGFARLGSSGMDYIPPVGSECAAAEETYAGAAKTQPPPVASEMKEREAGLVTDLRRVWHGPRTLAHDRKRMRRLVARDLILLRDDVIREAKSPLPLGVPDLRGVPSAVLGQVRALAIEQTDARIGESLDVEWLRTGTGLPFSRLPFRALRTRPCSSRANARRSRAVSTGRRAAPHPAATRTRWSMPPPAVWQAPPLAPRHSVGCSLDLDRESALAGSAVALSTVRRATADPGAASAGGRYCIALPLPFNLWMRLHRSVADGSRVLEVRFDSCLVGRSRRPGSHAKPVRIVLFRSTKEYSPYRPGEVADAHYLPTRDADLIVLLAGRVN